MKNESWPSRHVLTVFFSVMTIAAAFIGCAFLRTVEGSSIYSHNGVTVAVVSTHSNLFIEVGTTNFTNRISVDLLTPTNSPKSVKLIR